MNLYKKNIAFTIAVLLMVIVINNKTTSNDNSAEYYYKINKSFEIFGSVFRELENNYVRILDPDELMNNAISGMLENLDPYTVFINEEESDDIDFITTGSYVGIGVNVGVVDSMLTILNVHDDFPASKSGIRTGDRILMADTAYVLYKSSDELRKLTRGKPNTTLDLMILRSGRNDTLKFSVTRQEIKVKSISYFGILRDSTGYIKLDRFTRFTAEEVRTAIYSMRRQGMNSLIIDLRENPGGLLESAVSVSEIFVPVNSPIVSTKGRNISDERIYKSILKPLEPNIPLVVLINGGSASASEIVAGAIQDLDRGLIIGTKSFGKGLVQSVLDLPYNSNLKITTAKYYTPSGRCIQKNNYQNEKNKIGLSIHYDSVYYTLKGRPVIESSGIIPDSIVEQEKYDDYVNDLLKKWLIFNFANEITSSYELNDEIKITDSELIKRFKQFLNGKGYVYSSKISKEMDSFSKLIDEIKLSKKLKNEFNSFSKKVLTELPDLFDENEKVILKLLKIEINQRLKSNKQNIENRLKYDIQVSTALDILNPGKYSMLLSNGREHLEKVKN